ncbi:MAG TPA: hypothetical protein VFT21_08530, partial [Gemmatimonadaceae bacterium]|nr:hypothetical protein [Gemmatimonadaceae bacterium]
MKSNAFLKLAATSLLALAAACDTSSSGSADSAKAAPSVAGSDMQRRLAEYTTYKLTVDTTNLTAKERQMLPLLIDAAKAMDPIFWEQTYGSRDSLLAGVSDAGVRSFIDTNYGPYDRLDNNAAFVPEIGPRPDGANLYPKDITKEEFEAAVAKGPKAHADSLKDLYTLVRRAPD